jgi:hypothetical protein
MKQFLIICLFMLSTIRAFGQLNQEQLIRTTGRAETQANILTLNWIEERIRYAASIGHYSVIICIDQYNFDFNSGRRGPYVNILKLAQTYADTLNLHYSTLNDVCGKIHWH